MKREERLRNTPCSVDGCASRVTSFNPQLCAKHRTRLAKYGTTDETPMTMRLQRLDAAWSLLSTPQATEPGDCWLWPGAKNRQGYGQINRRGEALAHRGAWVATYGPIPDGLYVCHKCDTRACYRPSHLFLGSALDNTHDMLEKGRQFAGDGRPDGRIRLTDEQVDEVRAAVAGGQLIVDVAYRYGVSKTLVGLIVRGRRRPYPTGVSPAQPAQLRSDERVLPGKKLPTHCPQNHAYTAENTGVRPNGHRWCRTCSRVRNTARRQSFRAAA